MKLKITLAIVFILSAVSIARSQHASEGKAVVAHGFENSDLIRFGLLRPYDVGYWYYDNFKYVDTLIDSLYCTAVEGFEWWVPANKALFGHQKTICVPGYMDGAFYPRLSDIGYVALQRTYWPLPSVADPRTGHGPIPNFNLYGFAYIDSGAIYHNNTYDANDVNPYLEYPAKDDYVKQTFATRRFDASKDSTVYFGNEGRVILGYNDDRSGTHFLTTPIGYPYPHIKPAYWAKGTKNDDGTYNPNGVIEIVDSVLFFNLSAYRANLIPRLPAGYDTTHLNTYIAPGPIYDTAKAFSVNLEFWLDDDSTHFIKDSALTTNSNNLPLVRVQVLYKRGAFGSDPGQSVLPFVPFADASHPSNPGWYKCLDTTITRLIYDSLPADWRAEDSTFNGSGGHASHSWRFKQLHTMITMSDSMIATAKRSIKTAGYSDAFGFPIGISPVTSSWHPDLLVAYNTTSEDKTHDIIELRVLSTYRTPVRIRDLTYQDTMVDRYLNRRRDTSTGTTYSVEQNGHKGGNDFLVDSSLKSWNTLLGSNVPREIMLNDIGLPNAGFSAMGYLESRGAKYNIYCHMRPQDRGDVSEQWRRERMSFDGQPPSIFENQSNNFGMPVLPRDYVYYGHPYPSGELSKPWRKSLLDTLMGAIVGRAGDTVVGGTDTLQAYKYYTLNSIPGELTLLGVRAMARVGLWHPWSKRFATEYSIMTFDYLDNGAYLDTSSHVHYHGYRDPTLGVWILPRNYAVPVSQAHPDGLQWIGNSAPFSSELISSIIYGSVANGASCYSAAEAFDNVTDDWHNHHPAMFSPAKNTNPSVLARFTHDYNVGHYYSCRGLPWGGGATNSDQDDSLQKWYLGLSNTARAYKRATSRFNAIWNAGPHPLKNLRWLDSYNQYYVFQKLRNVSSDDTIAEMNAFLKVKNTQAVDPWHYDSITGGYIDRTVDPDTMTLATVGLFIDSINSSTKNYAALVVNPRTWPGRDSADLAYFNTGLNDTSKRFPTLGDIDVRKIYLKFDGTKVDPSWAGLKYLVVTDLWHPDSSWLVKRDSTFAIYVKPGDAKFLYFQQGFSINVASKTGTDSGKSLLAEFGFSNGRRVAERYHGTRSLVTYTRNHKLYVANPAAGSTFSGPDQSSGDNIITGNETPLDLVHTCARPSICPAQNDIGVAIAYWYITDSLSGAGRLAVFYQKDNSSPWQSAVNSAVFMDATSDYHWVTPVLTPINDTAWIVAAGSHAAGLLGGIKCLIFITPHTGTPRFSSSMPQLAVDTIIGGTIYRALYPTVTSRPIADSLYPFRIAWQRAIKAGKHNIYYQRWRHLSDTTRNADTLVNVSKGLDACDNVHPSLALNGTIQNPCPTCDYLIPDNVFYDDHLTWEAKLARPGANSGSNYWPVIRARAELTFPHHGTGWWGVYNVQNLDLGWHGFHWPQVSTEPRVWNGLFWYPNNNSTVHDWIRVGFQNKGYLEFLSWTPNWYTYWPFEGALPSLAQSTSRMESWTDSSTVPHSFVFLPDPSSSGPQHVQITNAWLSGFEPHVFSAVLLLFNDTMAEAQCSGIIGDIILSRGNTLPTNPSDPAQNITWSPMDITKYGVDADWPMMPRTLNEIHTNNFKIHSSDSIFIDRAVGTTDFTSVRNALSSSSDFVTFRMTLRKSSDSSYLATMDSMSITKSTTYWAGAAGVSMDTSMVSFRAPVNDSAFAMVELIRGDSLDYLSRSYVESLDTLAGSPPAPKRSTAYSSVQEREPLVVAVYPNPSTGFATVNITSLTGGLPAVVKVYDVLDNEVATLYEGTPAGDMGLRLTFDGSHLAAGTYYIRAQNAIMGGMVKLQIIR